MRTPHRQVAAGKRVLVILRDGTRFVDRFVEFTNRRLVFREHTIDANQLRRMSIYRGVLD